MVRTTRKKSTGTGRHAAGAERDVEPAEVNEVAEAGPACENTRVAALLAERVFRGHRGRMHDWTDLGNTASPEGMPETQQDGFSQAVAWMSEPEWNGEWSEEMSETSAGGREPECWQRPESVMD